MEELRKIDHSSMTVNQIVIVALGILAFVLDQPWLAAFVTAVLLLGTLIGRPGSWFQVIEIDAGSSPELAQEWGVLSVPTTFVVDGAGKSTHVNHGVTSAEKLIHQLELEDYTI